MKIVQQLFIAAATTAVMIPVANGAMVHAGAPISVPVDSPVALGTLAIFIAIVVARALHKFKD